MLLFRLFALTLFIALAALIAASTLLVIKGSQAEPLVVPGASARQEDVARIKALVRQNDPRDLRDGETRTVSMSQRDLNLGLQVAMPYPDRQQAQVKLGNGMGTLLYSLRVPESPLGEYLNLTLLISEDRGQPSLEGLQVGNLSIPAWLLKAIVPLLDRALDRQFPEYARAINALGSIALTTDELKITYQWDKALAKQIEQRGREVFLPEADRERVLAYYQVLTKTSREVGSRASLAHLLQPLFTEAVDRSQDGDSAQENRALLLMLGTILNRSSMHRLVGGDAADLAPGHQYVNWTLYGRGDLAQHFGISAAIAAAGGGTLADAIGVFKELDDSRGGSGFSFVDLLADRAGVTLSDEATGANAQHLQRAMASSTLDQADFMPAIHALPEGLMEMEFKQRYRDLDDARYAYVKGEIDMRIEGLPIYR